MTRWTIRALSLIVLCCCMHGIQVVAADSCEKYVSRDCPVLPTSTPTGYRYVFDGTAFMKAPTSGMTEQDGQQYRAEWTPVCMGNVSNGEISGDGVCAQAALLCPRGEIRLWRERHVNADRAVLLPRDVAEASHDGRIA